MKEIVLNHGFVAQVDDEDYELLSSHTWRVLDPGKFRGRYAVTSIRDTSTGKQKTVLMHRMIMEKLGDSQGHVDHRDSDGLNNQRTNLRLCQHSDNMKHRRKTVGRLTSQYKGVALRVRGNCRRWQADIQHNGKHIYIGAYLTEHEAALAYNAAAMRLHGDYSLLNKVVNQ